MISVEYHADLKEVQSDAALAALLGDGAQSAPFDRLAWWQGLADHCGLDPLLAVARNGAGLAVLPLAQGRKGIDALANWYTFRFRPLVTPGADGTRLLRALAGDLAGRSPGISLAGVPGEDGSRAMLESAFGQAGWLVFSAICDTNHTLQVNGRSFADYLAERPGQLQTTLRRKSGKLETTVLTRIDAQAWAEYEAIYAESWKPHEGSPEFLRRFAAQEAAAGRLRLGIARAGGRAVAVQLWTLEGGTAFIHKLAHREQAKALSPGTVLSGALFEHVIDRDGAETVDFGTGDDPFKRDWMEQARPRYRLDMYRPESPANWLAMARAASPALPGAATMARARAQRSLAGRQTHPCTKIPTANSARS